MRSWCYFFYYVICRVQIRLVRIHIWLVSRTYVQRHMYYLYEIKQKFSSEAKNDGHGGKNAFFYHSPVLSYLKLHLSQLYYNARKPKDKYYGSSCQRVGKGEAYNTEISTFVPVPVPVTVRYCTVHHWFLLCIILLHIERTYKIMKLMMYCDGIF